MFAYPDVNAVFEILTFASEFLPGVVLVQYNYCIAFFVEHCLAHS